MRTGITNLRVDESGATAIEYGLIAALLALVIITSAIAVGTDISRLFGTVMSNALSVTGG